MMREQKYKYNYIDERWKRRCSKKWLKENFIYHIGASRSMILFLQAIYNVCSLLRPFSFASCRCRISFLFYLNRPIFAIKQVAEVSVLHKPNEISLSLELSSSVRIRVASFVPVLQLSIGSLFAADHSTYHREGKAEEKSPEADNFDEEPDSAILLDLLAALAVVAHVDHVHDSVYDNSKQSVESRHVPDPSPFHADAYNGEKDCSSNPFHHVIEG